MELIKIYIKKKTIWCASSTHNTEELIVAKTHKKLKKKIKNLLTIIIPRHINRKEEIINSLKFLDLNIYFHSSKKKIKDNIDIYFVDTYGETQKFFKISKAVFLGGSLIKHGGQNPLEAARLGCKILHGKYINNFLEIYTELRKNSQSIKINNQNDLSLNLKKILSKKNKSKIFIKKLNKTGDKILKRTNEEILKYI